MTQATVFLTGATGFIGGELLKRLLTTGAAAKVFALCRAKDALDLKRRGHEVLFKLFPTEDGRPPAELKQRIEWVRGDLTAKGLGLSAEDRAKIVAEADTILHAAASTDFDLPEDQARVTNFEGAKEVLALAEEIGKRGALRRHVHVSTAYVAGKRCGTIYEKELLGPAGPYGNTYELTKAAAERLLRERMADLPITVVRPSIVVGDSATGRTYNFNVLYYPIKLIHRGQLTWAPGLRETTLDIVPVDYVCDGTLALMADPRAAGGTYHLTAGTDAIPLQRFADRLAAYYNHARHQAGQPPLVPTKVVGPWRWKLLCWWLRKRLRGRALEQLEAFNLYLPYLLTEKVFDTSEARALLGDKVPYPPVAGYLERVADYAVTREWGKRVSWDPSLLESGVWRGASAVPGDDEPGAK